MSLAPKEHPEQPPSDPHGSTVRGVLKLKPRLDRPSPYGVQWRAPSDDPDKDDRKKEFFANVDDRDRRFNALITASKKGILGDEMPRAEKVAWRAFRAAIGETPWQDVVAGWRSNLTASGKVPCTLTVVDACKDYLTHVKELLARDEIGAGTECHKRQKIGLFSDTFGANKLDAVSGEDIETWIDDLGFEANATFNSYRKQIRSLYAFHRKVSKDPCADIPQRSEAVEVVEILTVPQTAQLFAYALAHHRDALGRLALEAFAGIRFSSAFRLEKKDLNFEDRGILLPAHKMKTDRRHYIDGLPENLWKWLAVTNDACWAMESTDWMHLKSRLFTNAKVPHPRNCLNN